MGADPRRPGPGRQLPDHGGPAPLAAPHGRRRTAALAHPPHPGAPVLRALSARAGVAVLVLGYLGLREYLRGPPAYPHGIPDIVYDDLQLFVLGSDPLQDGGPVPVTLQLAKFGAPAVTLL